MNKKLLIFSLSLLTLVSCGGNQVSTSSSSLVQSSINQEVELTTFEERELVSPKNIIDTRKELSYLIDYLTFYQIKEQVYVKLSESYQKEIKNLKFEFSQALASSLIGDVFVVDLDQSKYRESKVIGLQVFVKEFASEKTAGNQIPTLLRSMPYNQVSVSKDLPLMKENKGQLHVSNSEQLYYALANNYLPVPSNEKMTLLNEEIKKVASSIYQEDHSEVENLLGAYNYLTQEVVYDKIISKSDDFDLEKNQAYFLEGTFFNHLGVCDSKSKAYVALSSYLGIENKRIRAKNDNGSLHAYNYVKVEDTWYLSDSTNGSRTYEIDETLYQVPNYEMFLTTLKTLISNWTYTSSMHKEIEERISLIDYDIFDTLLKRVYRSQEDIIEAVRNNLTHHTSFEFKTQGLSTQDIMETIQKLVQDFPSYSFEALENIPQGAGFYTILIF